MTNIARQMKQTTISAIILVSGITIPDSDKNTDAYLLRWTSKIQSKEKLFSLKLIWG